MVKNLNGTHRFLWLTVGVICGMCLSYFWPHEPAYAVATDRDGDRFAITTTQTNGNNSEAVFVLDFLTGRLTGAALNGRLGKFTYAYFRNLAADFNVDPTAKPHYVIVSGTANLPNQGRTQIANSCLYVAEMSSGTVVCYGFTFVNNNAPAAPQPLIPIDKFSFRQAQGAGAGN